MATPPTAIPSASPRRASDRGFLPMLLDEYLQLLDWTGRQVRSGQRRGRIPQDLLPILSRLQLNEQTWLDERAEFWPLVSSCRRSIGEHGPPRGSCRQALVSRAESLSPGVWLNLERTIR